MFGTRADAETDDAIMLDPARLQALLDDDDNKSIAVVSVVRSRMRVEAASGPPRLTDTRAGTARQEVSLLLLLLSEAPVSPAADDNGTAADCSGLRVNH